MTAKTNADRLREILDSDRLRATRVIELLDEWADVRPWAEALAEIADEIDNTRGACETYKDAVGRDEKSEARDEAFDAIEQLLATIVNLDGLSPMPELSESGEGDWNWND